MNAELQVSVVIPTAQLRFLRDCLAGLANQESRNSEVIVVENGPRSRRVQLYVEALAAHVPVKYLYQQEAGLNRARNRGCLGAGHEVVALIDLAGWPNIGTSTI